MKLTIGIYHLIFRAYGIWLKSLDFIISNKKILQNHNFLITYLKLLKVYVDFQIFIWQNIVQTMSQYLLLLHFLIISSLNWLEKRYFIRFNYNSRSIIREFTNFIKRLIDLKKKACFKFILFKRNILDSWALLENI